MSEVLNIPDLASSSDSSVKLTDSSSDSSVKLTDSSDDSDDSGASMSVSTPAVFSFGHVSTAASTFGPTAPQLGVFTFGGGSTSGLALSSNQSKPASQFGQSSVASSFQFGATTTAAPPASTTSFGGFGVAAVTTTAPSSGFGGFRNSSEAFTFGGKTAAPATTPVPTFSFGVDKAAPPASIKSFTFGSSNSAAAAPSGVFQFGVAPAPAAAPAPNTGFNFGVAAQSPPSNVFNFNTAPSNPATGSNPFSATVPPSNPVPSNPFSPSPGGAAPVTNPFGAPQNTATPFGGFGTSAPATGGFGAQAAADLFTPERKNGEIGQDQTSQAGSIGRYIIKIEKLNKEIVMEVEKSNKNLGIRKQKMEDLVEKQTLDKKILAKKYKEELSLLEKNQSHEITTLQETSAIENRDEQRYIASLKEHRDELVQELEKLTNDAGNSVSSHERSKLEPITRSLVCPVCMELMRPPTKIWMCRLTHVICEVCKDHLIAVGGNCPTCTTEPFIGRNYMAEDLARTVFNE